MPFDPNKPFEAAETPSEKSSGFDATAPFETVEAPKPTKPSKIVGVGPGGEAMPADLEALKSQIDVSSGLISGVAQVPVGIGQALSDLGASTPRGKAEAAYKARKGEQSPDVWTEWAKTLKDFGDPTAQKVGRGIGETGEFMLGGEFLTGSKLAGEVGTMLAPYAERYVSPLVPEYARKAYQFVKGAAPEAEAAVGTTAAELTVAEKELDAFKRSLEMLKEGATRTAQQLPGGIATGAATGGIIGGEMGAVDPRTEDTVEKRQAARWEEIKHGVKTGALFGGALGTAASSLQLLGEFGALGWEQMTLSQRNKAIEKIEKYITENKDKIVLQAEEFSTIAKAEKEAAQKAKEAGLTPQQARDFIQAEVEKVKLVEGEAQKIVDGFKQQSTESKVGFGEYVKQKLTEFKAVLEKNREDAAGFTAALESAPEGKVVDVQPVVDYIDKLIAEERFLPKSPTLTMLKNIRSNFVQEGEEVAGTTAREAAEEMFQQVTSGGGKPLPEGGSGITVQAANEARKEWNQMLSQREMSALGVNAVSESQIFHLQKILDMLNKQAGAAHPPYMDAVNVFRAESRNLDPFRTGGFKGLGSEEMLTGENAKMGAEILSSVLKQARAGDKELTAMIKGDPEFTDMAKKYFLGELLSSGDIKKNTFQQFYNKNAEVLDEAGLLGYFKSLEGQYMKGQLGVEAAKNALEAKKVESRQLRTQNMEGTKAEAAAANVEKTTANIVDKLAPITDPVQQAKQIQTAANEMFAKNLISREQRQQFINDMTKALEELDQEKKLKKMYEVVRYFVGGAVGAAAMSGYAATPTGVGRYLSGYSPGGHRKE